MGKLEKSDVGRQSFEYKQAKHSHRKRLMMSGEHGAGQVAERSPTIPTKVMLAIRLNGVVAIFDDMSGVTIRTLDAFRPTELPYHLITLRVINP